MAIRNIFYRARQVPRAVLAISVAALTSLPGCTTVQVQNKINSITEIPTPKKTVTSDVLGCVSDMLAEYRRASSDTGTPKPIRVALVTLRDKTNVSSESYPDSEIPNDMTDMALSVMSTMGGPVRIVHVPNSGEYLDDARAGSGEKFHRYFLNFVPSHYRGDTVLLYGALTEYDRFAGGKSRTKELSSTLGSGEYETQLEAEHASIRNMARMTMDFRVVHPGVGDIVNHSSSSNTLTLYQSGKDRSYGISVDGTAIGYSKSVNEVDARHHALRLLTELGIAEAIGKYFYIPYWKCYPGFQKNQLVRFLDLTTMPEDDDLLFSPFAAGGATIIPSETEKPAEANTEEETVAESFRDDDMVLALITNYLYGEYLHNGTRQFGRREEEKSLVHSITDRQVYVDGLQQMRKRILSIYRKNIKRYSDTDDATLLTELTDWYRQKEVIRESDNERSINAYLALWLNAPIARHASRFH